LHKDFGYFSGVAAKKFMLKHRIKPNFIAAHGHTIFHQPGLQLTFQIGCGATVAAITGVDTCCDFRSTDVALGGQGAPLVPIGDELLFSDFDLCLNLGGFANISFRKANKRLAYDICPANIVLNELAQQLNKSYDRNGALARKGQLNNNLLEELNNIPYYSLKAPKSLGKEWVKEQVWPLLNRAKKSSVEDKLATFCYHIAEQVAQSTKGQARRKMLVTGGGAFNGFLMTALKASSAVTLVVPDRLSVSFKEALIFAFLGVLRSRDQVNALRSVTGAKKDSVGGAWYKGA
jgi:anhydro-N-acetylmuramic acid kinase